MSAPNSIHALVNSSTPWKVISALAFVLVVTGFSTPFLSQGSPSTVKVSDLPKADGLDAELVALLLGRWPPRPENIFNQADPTGPTVAAGSAFDIFTVPADKWLVITDLAVTAGIGEIDGVLLAERVGGIDHLKIHDPLFGDRTDMVAHLSNAFGLGVTFRPGSTVRLVNRGAVTTQINYSIIGYLVND